MKKLPAGVDEGFNIFLNSQKVLQAFINGVRVDYINLPTEMRSIFSNEMLCSKKICAKLKEMGYSTKEEMELKFVGCRYGSFNEPDLINGKPNPDAPNCENIGRCPGCGVVCILPSRLSRQEFIIAKLIAEGKQDKEICVKQNITPATVRTYFSRIHEKLCLNNRIEIALWAYKTGIV